MPALLNLFQGIQQAIVHATKSTIAHAKQMVSGLDVSHHLLHQLIDVGSNLYFVAHAGQGRMGIPI